MTHEEIILGTRGSELARTQSGQVAEAVTKLTGLPVRMLIIKTQGDRIQDVPLHLVEGKGFFTKELEEALLSCRIDLAVHSLKDLPTESPEGLVVAVIPAREMANDLLLVRDEAVNETHPYLLPPNPVIGTSSKRRALQVKALEFVMHFVSKSCGKLPTQKNACRRDRFFLKRQSFQHSRQ